MLIGCYTAVNHNYNPNYFGFQPVQGLYNKGHEPPIPWDAHHKATAWVGISGVDHVLFMFHSRGHAFQVACSERGVLIVLGFCMCFLPGCKGFYQAYCWIELNNSTVDARATTKASAEGN